MSSEPPFYFVWSEEGSVPKHKHRSETGAVTEAKRLARQYAGREFFVLTCTSRVVQGETIVETFEIPF
jgi:hypothetical protein